MGYEVQTPVFEGPFDLLLHLILKEEVDLFEVSLSLIVDRYLAEVARLDRVDLEVATEFLLIAATLVELKARRLLPGRDDLELDDELSRWDERDYLIARLLECKTFQDASRHLLQTMQIAALVAPGRRARGAVPLARARSARAGLASPSWPKARTPGSRPTVARGAHRRRPRRAGARQRARRGRDGARVAAIVGFGHLPRSGVRRGRAPRGRRAVPRRPRALQAGPRRPRAGVDLRRAHGAAAAPGERRCRPHLRGRVGRRRSPDESARVAEAEEVGAT